MIEQLTIERIKDSSNIAQVIGDFYELKKKGTAYECLCPFHSDKHMGSFVINPRKNTYTCFSCGEHGDSIEFLMKHEKISFLEAVRWLGKKYGIRTDEDWKGAKQPKICKPRIPMPKLPTLELDSSMVQARQNNDNNTFVNWLRSLPWNDNQKARIEGMLNNYLIGTSKSGHTIFWQIDEKGKIRTGKMMLYKSDGHRDKETKGNFSWVHSKLIKAGAIDADKSEMRQCLFGLHLTDVAGATTINIVESEKTAIICAIAYGNMKQSLWMATGGKTQLTREKLKPLIDRGVHIYLYPDHDGIDEWKDMAKGIGYNKLYVNADVMTKYWQPEDGPTADIADILIRRMQKPEPSKPEPTKETRIKPGPQLISEFIEENPLVQTLIERFDLEPIKVTRYAKKNS